MDGLASGVRRKGAPIILAEFRTIYQGIIIGNCGYTEAAAEERIAEGSADLIAFGRPFITNADLPERFKHNWPLNPAEDKSLWYAPGARGYTDYAPFELPSSV